LDDLWVRHDRLLAERLITGRELTVGVLGSSERPMALPTLQIVPADGAYDYAAKYDRSDTTYRFSIDAPASALEAVREAALRAYRSLGCRDLARVDLILDDQGTPWVLEVNTLPGFTDHSLLPMAAERAGLSMPALVDRLVRQVVGPRRG
jgi:D-alanine-D-alanine ligase